LSNNTLIKKEFTPEYGISDILNRAAAECSTGIDVLLNTDVKITASLRVQVPEAQSGSNKPL